ncbi:MAG: putative secreted hydrolase [Myxococcota bacterium]|jgi:predicted secreted hydrolase
MRRLFLAIVTTASIGCDSASAPEEPANDTVVARCELPSTARVTLPADDARHPDTSEWYYWTGHLNAADGRRFGFQLTLLMAGPESAAVVIAQRALTDIDSDRFDFDVTLGATIGAGPAGAFDFEVTDVAAASGANGEDRVTFEVAGRRVTLDLSDVRGPVVRHSDGFQAYTNDLYTYYYARPRMDAAGTVEIDGEVIPVTGTAWFDHQWGQLSVRGVASRWDWMGLQLDDGREVMVYRVPQAGGAPGETDTYAEVTDRDCVVRHYAPDEVTFASTRTWTNPLTVCTYPMDWQLQLGDEAFDIVATVDQQDLVADPTTGFGLTTYWEGAADVVGASSGRAYVEMVGYCPHDAGAETD